MKGKPIFVAAGLAVLLTIGFLYNKYRIAPQITFNELPLTTLQGVVLPKNYLHDKKVFLNFFATWCGPCVKELPLLETAQQKLQQDSVVFLLISDEPLNTLQHFANTHTLPFTVLHSEKKFHDLKIETVPTSYLFNNKGEIIFRKVGVENWEADEVIQQLKI